MGPRTRPHIHNLFLMVWFIELENRDRTMREQAFAGVSDMQARSTGETFREKDLKGDDIVAKNRSQPAQRR